MAVLNLGDTRLRYERIAGDAAQPTLVFLHEGLGCIDMWRGFPARLCAALGCPGLLYDRVGYGGSSPLVRPRTIGYLHEAALQELPAVLEQLLPGADYVLIGHSDGGSIALLHAAARPARLRAIVTEAAHVFVEPVTLDGIRAAVEAYAAGKLRGLAKYHGDKTDAIFSAWADTWLGDGFRSWNIERGLESIACPALVIQGVDDQYGTAAQVESIVSRVPNVRAELVPECGHSPHQEQADVVLELMRAFLVPLLEPET